MIVAVGFEHAMKIQKLALGALTFFFFLKRTNMK